MRTANIIVKTVAAVLFLLCILAPQYTAAANPRKARDVESNTNGDPASLLSQSTQYISDGAAATFSKLEDITTNAMELPSWEKIVVYAKALLKVAEQSLDSAAREFNAAEKINEFKDTFRNILTTSRDIREQMTELTQKGLTLDQISDELAIIFNDIQEYLKKAFPPPDQAPSHQQRQEMLTSVLDKAEQGLLDLARKHGMSEEGQENLRNSFDKFRPHVEKLVVITGDLIEQHPVIASTLIFSAAAMLIPESWFLRPLLSLMGYGPSGPIKGSAAAWAQRRFWGAAVQKGSWFAFLQRAGMKGLSARPIMGAIGGAIGAVFGTLPCFLARSYAPAMRA